MLLPQDKHYVLTIYHGINFAVALHGKQYPLLNETGTLRFYFIVICIYLNNSRHMTTEISFPVSLARFWRQGS